MFLSFVALYSFMSEKTSGKRDERANFDLVGNKFEFGKTFVYNLEHMLVHDLRILFYSLVKSEKKNQYISSVNQYLL